MDLSDIEMWTRKALETEAAKRGIRDPHLRTRTALIRLILRKDYGDPIGRGRRRLATGLSALRQARELVSAAVEVAAETLPFRRTSAGELDAPTGHHAPQTTTSSETRPRDAAPATTTGEQPEAAGAPAGGPEAAPEAPETERRAPMTSDIVPSAPVTPTETMATAGPIAPAADLTPPPVPSELANAAEPPAITTPAITTPAGGASERQVHENAATGTGEPSPEAPETRKRARPTERARPARDAPAHENDTTADVTNDEDAASASGAPGAASATSPAAEPTGVIRVFEREPIRTHSMARLLARQGHRQRALAIYEELLARHTDEPSLLREAQVLREDGDVSQIPSHLPGPPSDRALPKGADHIACEDASDGGVAVHWEVTPEGTARAEAVLGQRGELAVRVVAIAPDPETVVRSVITEYGPVPESGSWQAEPLGHNSRCFVAVGLRAEDRFVSIAHTQA